MNIPPFVSFLLRERLRPDEVGSAARAILWEIGVHGQKPKSLERQLKAAARDRRHAGLQTLDRLWRTEKRKARVLAAQPLTRATPRANL